MAFIISVAHIKTPEDAEREIETHQAAISRLKELKAKLEKEKG